MKGEEGREGAVREGPFLEGTSLPWDNRVPRDWVAGFLALAGLSPLDLQSVQEQGDNERQELEQRGCQVPSRESYV